MIFTIPKDYKLVYQSGHRNVYCNGKEHFRTTGGFTEICKEIKPLLDRGTGEIHYFKCDCEFWRKYIEQSQ